MLELQNRFENGLYGIAIGDAFGVPFQFCSRDYVVHFVRDDYKDKELFVKKVKRQSEHRGIPFGTWSDDTAMTLATIDSLEGFEDKKINYEKLVNNFLEWLYSGKYTQDGYAWDEGITTKESLDKYNHNKEFFLMGSREENQSGNGSLMRFLPIPYILYKKFGLQGVEKCNRVVKRMSSITHASDSCVRCCSIYTKIMIMILSGLDKDRILKDINSYLSDSEKVIFNKMYDVKKLTSDKIKSSGYVIDTIEAALWSFFTTDNFDDCIIRAVMLGDDTDTIASIAGGIAGSYYKNVNKEWLELLRKNEVLFKYRDIGLDLLK